MKKILLLLCLLALNACTEKRSSPSLNIKLDFNHLLQSQSTRDLFSSYTCFFINIKDNHAPRPTTANTVPPDQTASCLGFEAVSDLVTKDTARASGIPITLNSSLFDQSVELYGTIGIDCGSNVKLGSAPATAQVFLLTKASPVKLVTSAEVTLAPTAATIETSNRFSTCRASSFSSAPVLDVQSTAATTYITTANMTAFPVIGACSKDGVVTISGSANATTVCSGGSFNKSLDLSSVPDGTVTLKFDLLDALGKASTQVVRTFTKDTTAPVLAFSSPALNAYANAANMAAFQITGTCTEEGTVIITGPVNTTATCASGSFTKNLNLSSLSEGSTLVTLAMVDAAGNASTAVSRTFIKDSIGPALAFSTPAASTYVTSSNMAAFTVTGTCTDSGTITISGAVSSTATCNGATFSKALDLSSVNQGTVTLYLDMDDVAGNHAVQHSRSFSKDTVAPVLAFSTPAANAYVTSSNMAVFTITGTCTEDGTVNMGGEVTTTVACTSGSFTKDLNLTGSGQGSLTVNLDMTDAAGNLAVQKSRTFNKDTVAPTITFGSPAANTSITPQDKAAFAISGSCSDNGTINVSGTTSTTLACSGGSFSGNLNFSDTATGTVTVNLDLDDAAGNHATQATRNFVKDPNPPRITVFLTSTSTDGNLGGSGGADTLCNASTNKPTGKTGYAVISVDGAHEVRDLPTAYNFSPYSEVVGPNRKRIAATWNALLSGSLSTSLFSAGAKSGAGGAGATMDEVWSFSEADGSLSTDTCQAGTSSSNADTGTFGRTNYTTGNWINYGGFTNSCNQSKYLACITAVGVGIEVSALSSTTVSEAGGTSTFSVRLSTQPAQDVSIAVASSDTTEGTVDKSSLTFTNANWETEQYVTVTGVDDASADGPITFSITFGNSSSADANYNNLATASLSIINLDNEPVPPLVMYLSSNRYDGGNFGGYSGADTICNSDANKPAGKIGYAMISQGSGHQMTDLATINGLDTSVQIKNSSGMVIASNWSSLMSSSFTNSLSTAGITSDYWTFTNTNGSNSSNSCNNGGSSSSAQSGEIGRPSYTSGLWLKYSTVQCDFLYYLLCIAKAY